MLQPARKLRRGQLRIVEAVDQFRDVPPLGGDDLKDKLRVGVH
jgi:hypothetical protein